jgi:beta-glucosidase
LCAGARRGDRAGRDGPGVRGARGSFPRMPTRLLPLFLTLAACAARPVPPQHAATIPAEHTEAAARNAELAQRARGSQAPLILLGDSITQGWEGDGRKPWDETLAPLGALDLGVGGDRTEHLLFRLKSGAYDALPVRAAVILIGTNNLGTGQTPAMTADGVAAVLDDVLARWPKCEILLLAIFPRDEQPDGEKRQLVERTNVLLHELALRDRVTWLDIGDLFLAPDGTLPKATMPDSLHLSEAAYRTWAAQLREPLARML